MDAKKLALHALGTWVFLRTGQRLRRAEAEPGEARRNALKSLARRKLAGIITEGMKEGGLLRSVSFHASGMISKHIRLGRGSYN